MKSIGRKGRAAYSPFLLLLSLYGLLFFPQILRYDFIQYRPARQGLNALWFSS